MTMWNLIRRVFATDQGTDGSSLSVPRRVDIYWNAHRVVVAPRKFGPTRIDSTNTSAITDLKVDCSAKDLGDAILCSLDRGGWMSSVTELQSTESSFVSSLGLPAYTELYEWELCSVEQRAAEELLLCAWQRHGHGWVAMGGPATVLATDAEAVGRAVLQIIHSPPSPPFIDEPSHT